MVEVDGGTDQSQEREVAGRDILENWAGHVDSIGEGDTFFGACVDLDGKQPDMEMEFSKVEIYEPFRSLVQPGAMFRWRVEIVRYADGGSELSNAFTFVNPRHITEEEVREGKELAARAGTVFESPTFSPIDKA